MEASLEDFNEQIELAASGYVAISTRDLQRAVRFYSRLFGFRVIERRHDHNAEHVLMGTRSHAFLALHEHQAAAVPPPGATHWTFAVPDLDRARAAAWNRGVVPVRGRMSEERSFDDAQCCLVIRDPDGHEIELVEEPSFLQLREPVGTGA